MPTDTDTTELLDVADDVLPADWSIHEAPNVDLRLKGRRDMEGVAWTYELALEGARWTGTATADGTEVASVEVTYAASYDPTEPQHFRTVAKQLRGRVQKSNDAPSN
jgi:hypothetical protein